MPTATKKKPKAPATDPLSILADGDLDALAYYRRLRKRIKALSVALDEHDDQTLPRLEEAEKAVEQLERRIVGNQSLLAKAKDEAAAAREAHDQGGKFDERCRRLDSLVHVAPREVIDPIPAVEAADDDDGTAPKLTAYADAWGEHFLDGDPLRVHDLGLFQRVADDDVGGQADDARSRGIPIALIRTALRRRCDSIDGGDESRRIIQALAELREWEQ